MLTPTNIALTILLINAWTFCVFGYDKLQAEGRRWRVSGPSPSSLRGAERRGNPVMRAPLWIAALRSQ